MEKNTLSLPDVREDRQGVTLYQTLMLAMGRDTNSSSF